MLNTTTKKRRRLVLKVIFALYTASLVWTMVASARQYWTNEWHAARWSTPFHDGETPAQMQLQFEMIGRKYPIYAKMEGSFTLRGSHDVWQIEESMGNKQLRARNETTGEQRFFKVIFGDTSYTSINPSNGRFLNDNYSLGSWGEFAIGEDWRPDNYLAFAWDAIPFSALSGNTLLFGILLSLWIWWGIRLKKADPGLCPDCSYDLRGQGTQQGCPECGWNRPA